MLSLIRDLYNEYKVINERVRNLNRGGCGVFAEKLYRLLIDLRVDAKIFIMTENAEGMRKRLTENEPYAACIVHVLIMVEGKLIDSEGIWDNAKAVPLSDWGSELYETDLATLVSLNSDGKNTWNPCFDREQIPLVEQILKEAANKFAYIN